MMEATSSRFTAAEGGARLAAAAVERNILVVEHTAFISTRLLYEDAYKIRGKLSGGRKRSVQVTRPSRVATVAYDYRTLTDLKLVAARASTDVADWRGEIEASEVIVCTSEVLKHLLKDKILTMNDLNILIIDSCHLIYKDDNLKYILKRYKENEQDKRPRILALTYPLFNTMKMDTDGQTTCNTDETTDTTNTENNSELEDVKTIDKDAKAETNNDSLSIDNEDSKGETKELPTDNEVLKPETKDDVSETSNHKEDTDVETKIETELSIDNVVLLTEVSKSTLGKSDKVETIDKLSDEVDSVKIVSIDKTASEESIDKHVNTQSSGSNTENEIGVYKNYDDFHMYEQLEWKIEELERELCCQMDLAEDIDGGKRLSVTQTKLLELIVEHSHRPAPSELPEPYVELENYMRTTIDRAMAFLNEHRYDLTEIYGDDIPNEFKDIPDPGTVPKQLFKQFLYILDQLGPYSADIAAFSLLMKLETLCIKTPFERHFLLLRLCTTVFVKIRCYADQIFSACASDWDKIKDFSTPKVLRLVEILEKFQPENIVNKNDSKMQCTASKLMSDIDNCDFIALSNRIEDKVHTMEANLREIVVDNGNDTVNFIDKDSAVNQMDSPGSSNSAVNTIDSSVSGDVNRHDSAGARVDSVENRHNSAGTRVNSAGTRPNSAGNRLEGEKTAENLWLPKRTGPRSRGRGRPARSNASRLLQQQQNPDALCGVMFMNEPLMAKILFYLIVDMSRHNPSLSYLRAQYCAAGGETGELRDCQRQGKKQEDVLKKFRMHECNLLLATSALEEGIDLPRCNLVLRWDLPSSYRSHGACRGRARAARATSALISSRSTTTRALRNLAAYRELDQIISRKCGCGVQDEPPQSEEDHADAFTSLIQPYTPLDKHRKTEMPIEDGKECRTTEEILEIDTNMKDLDLNTIKTTNVEKYELITDGNVVEPNDTLERENNRHSIENDNEIELNYTINRASSVTNSINNDDTQSRTVEIKYDGNLLEKDIGHGVKDDIDNVSAEIKDMRVRDDSEVNNLESVMLETKRDVCLVDEDNGIGINCDINEAIVFDVCSYECDDVDINDAQSKKQIVTDIDKHLNKIDIEKEINCDDELYVNKIDDTSSMNGVIDKRDVIDINDIPNICNETINICNNKHNNENISNLNNINNKIENSVENAMQLSNDVNNDNSEPINIGSDNLVTNLAYKEVKLNNQSDLSGNSDRHSGDVNRSDRNEKMGDGNIASVDLSTAISLINRYCAKLPSDTFTRLAPQWWTEEVHLPVQGTLDSRTAYICTLRLPLNCPVKYNIVGHPMPTRVLARRMCALQACRILHKSGELDNQLMPIGKENFKATELDSAVGCPGDSGDQNDIARPGTTKRRQYYYKKTAWAFTDCQPVLDATDADIEALGSDTQTEDKTEEKRTGKRNMLYAIVSKLWCALPERYNTRGRRLHAPQNATQALGILMAREQPDSLQIPAFPVYTRSGEVRVNVQYIPDADTRVSPRRAKLIRRFMRFVFSEVLRVQRRGMRLAADGGSQNNYYIVPTVKLIKEDGSTQIDIDWGFLELIYNHTEQKERADIEKPILFPEKERDPHKERDTEREGGKGKKIENPLLKPGEVFVFDPEKYKEAVVTPWYRNQDQPQFFLVAEICWQLSPESAFPSGAHASFREYYARKYGAPLSARDQPLLDVDHTSARLNLLTPRYVNRKGVALPVSSERTRRAKRDRLDQKQILVPELCRLHPFAAPLWFATVALPCVLYRINALLIADEIRRAVAIDVGLGIPKIDDTKYPDFQWPPLDFGWSLAEVLNADSEKIEKKKEDDDTTKNEGCNSGGISGKEETPVEESNVEEQKEKTVNDILQEKEAEIESSFEIGTWSNDMASDINDYVESLPLPPNLTLCTSASGGVDWSERPIAQFNSTRPLSVVDSDCSYLSSEFDTDDSDSDVSEDDSGFMSNLSPMSFRIEYKTPHEAEAFDVERKKVNPAPLPDAEDDAVDRALHDELVRNGNAPEEYIQKFRLSVASHEREIVENGNLIRHDERIKHMLPDTGKQKSINPGKHDHGKLQQMFPYNRDMIKHTDGQIDLESVERNKRHLLAEWKKSLSEDEIKKLKCFSMVDVDIDSSNYVNEKLVNVGFDTKDIYEERMKRWDEFVPYFEDGKAQNGEFDFDYQPKLEGHPGPSPSVILQALTMSNANDGINLERLETIGDSFLKFAITAYLYCAHPTVHEGKLSHMRSKQVSNLNLYRLGRCRRLGARMIASKFEPHDNWLPPCHRPPPTLQPPHKGDSPEQATPDGSAEASGCFIPYNLITQHSIPDKSIADCVEALIGAYLLQCGPRGALLFMSWLGIRVLPRHDIPLPPDHPYVVAAERKDTDEQKPAPQTSPKRSYDTESDTDYSSDEESVQPQQQEQPPEDWSWPGRPVGSLRPRRDRAGNWTQSIFGELKAPPSPLLRYIEDPEGELEQMLSGYDALERTLQYRFKDRSLLLQALTHASHNTNRLTDCYQRLEFLGDAILDYLITRHLYEDARRHSPGALTDLRSALVNNTIFAALAARHSFHKYFRHMSPGLSEVLTKYVKIQEENGHSISEEHYLIQEDEMEQAEDVEVPKALGDLFESVAGAIFLDSGMSLGAVWKSYVNLMGAELEAFSAAAPKSPVRELLEAEPDTAKFGKPERLADGRRVRVSVEVFGRGVFKGVGRNYRIAKGTAARCALRHLRASPPSGHRPR